jgi:threonine aldolase
MKIDLRSDTVTLPGPAMMEAMMNAKVGDDVFGEDPSVNELEAFAAALFGMEAAIYSPTGTMSNQMAIKSHTQPGDEIICEKQAHIYIYEGGGIAFNSGSQVRAIEGNFGRINAGQVCAVINPDDVHRARTSLVCLENSSNRGGGSCYDLEEIKKISAVCQEHKLSLHLDGARLFNALVAKSEKPEQYGKIFDSISICLNKGLGCPVGSILIGRKEFIKKARRIRKVFGGGMRQAGYMAACGIYALKNNVDRLKQDHSRAGQIGDELRKKDLVKSILPVETNIVIAEIDGKLSAREFGDKLKAQEILVIAISPTQVRFVTHLGISDNMIEKTVEAIHKL